MREKIVAEFRFVILNPGNGRAAFKIDKRPGTRVKDPRLDAINASYKSGRLDFEAARKAVEDLRHSLYKECRAIRAVVGNEDNLRLVEQYWESEYSHRDLQDPKTARYELDRVVDAVGTLSIHTATREELQAVLDKHSGNRQRRLAASLRRLLDFAGRKDIKIRKAKKEKRRVRSLSEKEFKFMLEYIPLDRYDTLMQVAFYTGARIGECFAIQREDFDERKLELKILGQVDKTGSRRDTKNRRDRVTIVLPNGVKALKEWFNICVTFPTKDRAHMAEIVREACIKAFPKDKSKHLTFHDLRHCYARQCRERGLSTEDVADLIGDSLIVAKEHYSGFGESDAIMDLRRKTLVKK